MNSSSPSKTTRGRGMKNYIFQPNCLAGYMQIGSIYIDINYEDGLNIYKIVKDKSAAYSLAKEFGVKKENFRWIDSRMKTKGYYDKEAE